MVNLRPFQKEFEKAVANPDYDTVAISGPRGLGKTFLAARILTRCMTPGDVLHEPGKTYILGAASIEQARLTYGFIRAALEPSGEYRFIDGTTRLGATHLPTNTKLRAISSNAKTSFGLVGVPLICIDEPGALEIVGGQMLADSLFTAQGKLGSKLKLILVGTLAPSAVSQGHWWLDLIKAGTVGSTHVQYFHGDLDTWDQWATIRKANPLVTMREAGDFRRKLLEERDAARADSRLKARFLSYRLNIPSRDESEMVLSPEDWAAIVARDVPERDGRPVVGVDLANGRAWASAVAWYGNGRTEALAVAPGIPSVEEQEKRDRVPSGQYQSLIDGGQLTIADGLRVQPPALLWEMIRTTWGKPRVIVCDRFRLAELQDAVGRGARVEDRVTRWSDASFDIRACRKYAKDGPLSIDQQSRALLAVSLSKAMVQNDDQGNCRIVKSGSHNQGRDDVAASLVLAAGATARMPKPSTGIYRGMI